jgi:hypothetical protein
MRTLLVLVLTAVGIQACAPTHYLCIASSGDGMIGEIHTRQQVQDGDWRMSFDDDVEPVCMVWERDPEEFHAMDVRISACYMVTTYYEAGQPW